MAGLPGFVAAAPVVPVPVMNPTPASTGIGAGVDQGSDPRAALLAAVAHSLANPAPVAPPAPVLSPITTDPLTQAINAKMAGTLQGPVTMANAYPAPVHAPAPIAPVAPAPALPPKPSYFQGLMAPLGGTFETLGHTAALAGDELFGSHQDVEAQKAALRQIDQNQNTIAQGNAQLGGLAGTIVRGGASLLQQAPALATMVLAPEAAPEVEGSTALGRAFMATLRNGAAAAPVSMLQGAGTAIGAGQSAIQGLTGGAVNALALGATGGSLAPEMEAIKAGHIFSAMGHNAVLGAGAGGAMQLGQNIETGVPLTQGVIDSAGAGAVGGAALGGAGAAVAKAGRSFLTRIGAFRSDIGAAPLESAHTAPEVAPATPTASPLLLTHDGSPATPTASPLLLTHDGSIKVVPTDASQIPLDATEQQPVAGAAYAQANQANAAQAIERDNAVQSAVAKAADQAKSLALPAPPQFAEAASQYGEIGKILSSPKLSDPGVSDALVQAGIKNPSALPKSVKNAPNIVDALENHAETAAISPERADLFMQAAGAVKQHLALLETHQNTLADYLTNHPYLQGAADQNVVAQAHDTAQSLLGAGEAAPESDLGQMLQQYQHNQAVMAKPSLDHPEVTAALQAAKVPVSSLPGEVRSADDLPEALTGYAANPKISPTRQQNIQNALQNIGDMQARKGAEQDALAQQIAAHPDANVKPAEQAVPESANAQAAPTPEAPVVTPTEKAAQSGLGAETQGQPLANEINLENSPSKRVAEIATAAVKKAETTPRAKIAAAHAAVKPYLPDQSTKYFPDNSKLPPELKQQISQYAKLKPFVDADKEDAALPDDAPDREERKTRKARSAQLDNLAHAIANHPAVSGGADNLDVLDRAAQHASDAVTHGRIQDIRDMTGWKPIDESQVKRAAIVVRRAFGNKVGLHVADLASKGRRGETDLKDIYLAAHALGHGLQTTYHESWHIAREQYLTPAERSMMDKAISPGTRRFKALQEWGKTHAGPGVRDQIDNDPVERPALYAEALMMGQLPKPGGMVGRLFGKVQDVLDRIKSGLNGAGFNSADDLVRKGFAGEFRNREPVMGIADANDRIDSELRGGVPRDVYARRLAAQKNGPSVYNPSQLNKRVGAVDDLGSVFDRDQAHALDEGTRQKRQESIRKARPKAIGGAIKDFVGSGAVPSYMAHRYSDFRRLYRATEARYMNSRSSLAQSAHIAPAYFPRYWAPFMKDSDGNLAKWPAKELAAADKMLMKGNALRRTYTPEELKAEGLSPKAIEIYRQGRALQDFTLENAHDAREYNRGLYQATTEKELAAAQSRVADLAMQIDNLDEKSPERAKLQKALEAEIQTVSDHESYLNRLNETRAEDRSKTERLKAEGYLPSLRDGKYIQRVALEMPKAAIALPRIAAQQSAHEAKIAEHLGALGMTRQDAERIAALPEAEQAKELIARRLDVNGAKSKLRAVKGHIAGLNMLAGLKDDAERDLASDHPEMTTTSSLAAFSHNQRATVEAETKAFLDHPDTKAMMQALGAKPIVKPIESLDSPEAYHVSNSDLMHMFDRVDARNMDGTPDFSGQSLSPQVRLQLMREALDKDSALFNSMVSRRDVIGANQNVRAALVQAATSAAEMKAAALHSTEQREAYGALQSSPRRNYATQYLDSMLTEGAHADPISAKLRKYASLSMLGGKITPALYTAFTNLPLMATHLAYNELDPGKIASRMTKAFGDTYNLSPEKLVEAARDGKGLGRLTPDEVQHLMKAHLDGSIEAQYAHLVRGGETGPMQTRAGAAAIGLAMSPLGHVESHLRMASELAFLRQFKDLTAAGKTVKGLDMDEAGHALPETDASKFARDMTNQTNQNYNREDAIPALTKVNGDLSTLLQFATPTYRIIGGAMAHLAHTDPKLLGMLLTGLGMAGGYQALPAMQDLLAAYNSASGVAAQRGRHAGPLGNGLSAQQMINQTIRENLPKELASSLIHGALSKTPGDIDLAPYVSMGDIGAGLAGSAVNQAGHLFGAESTPGPSPIPPAFSALSNTIEAAGDATQGNWQAALHHNPISAINALTTGLQELQSHQATTATGNKIGDVTPLQAMLKTLGLMPSSLENQFEKEQEDRYAMDVQKEVLGQYKKLSRAGLMSQNPALLGQAQKVVASYNAANPSMPITPMLGSAVGSTLYGRMNPLQSLMLEQLRNRQLHGMPQ